jgi:hypothetical protein
MARNAKTGLKKKEARIRELEKEIRHAWPFPNPKAATAWWYQVRELAELREMRPQDLKKQIRMGTYSTYSE